MTIQDIESKIILKARNRLHDRIESRALPLFKIASVTERAELNILVDDIVLWLIPEAETKAINKFMQKCGVS